MLEEEKNEEYDENAWYSGNTSAFIDHIMKEEEQNSINIQKEREEKIKKAYEEFKNSLGIYVCTNCGYVIDETKPQGKDGKLKKITSKLKKCPYCGAVVTSTLFKKVTKEQLKKLVAETKKKKNIKKANVKVSLDKMRKELEKVNDELTSDLNNGKISPENYSRLMVNLSYNIYKYYAKDEDIKLFFSEVRDFAYTNSKNALSRKYSIEKVDDKLDDLLNDYEKEKDLKYLMYSKKIEQEHLKNCTDEERESLENNIQNIEDNIYKLDKSVEGQKRYNENVQKIEDKAYDNLKDRNTAAFKKRLRQSSND